MIRAVRCWRVKRDLSLWNWNRYVVDYQWHANQPNRADRFSAAYWHPGLHAAKTLQELEEACGLPDLYFNYFKGIRRFLTGYIWGEVMLWGHIIEGAHGYRAEIGQPSAFFTCPNWPTQLNTWVRTVAEHHNLPVIDLSDYKPTGGSLLLQKINTEEANEPCP